ncbi:MAG: hypothetical protein JWR61_2678 [Ferruginibacter sp.]|uniref:hypothetical protein n=1 Tax=Ferruginibacter sp. TaxID=1940288 RepID=UPI00265B2DAD|nr:hypothetical protein [Ferruginibacter sp.]MDB5277723.1 hypothetical protein [Ferruginibacter sp.]
MSVKYCKYLFSASLLFIIFSCKKDTAITPVVPPGFTLSYGDSVFYLKDQSEDYIIKPTQALAGEYGGFPEGIEIDPATGAINVSKSETGLRYRITFLPTGSKDTISTILVISGINFLDGFYKLTTADSVLKPLYNAGRGTAIPGSGSGTLFDEGSNCNGAGCTVNVSNGTINLAQTVRNGVFGSTPSNNDRHEFLMNYRINDKSGKALNSLKVKLYYFDSINDVTQEVYDIIQSRNGTVFRTNLSNSSAFSRPFGVAGKPSKPRPPCIFILAR